MTVDVLQQSHLDQIQIPIQTVMIHRDWVGVDGGC